MGNDFTEGLAKNTKLDKHKLDKRFYDMLFGEVGGGSSDEVAATASVYLNRINKSGYEKALKGSAAYNKRSKQYLKAKTNNMNAFEKMVYKRNKFIVDKLVENPQLIAPYMFHENVEAFGEPNWAKDMESFKDIGRQRFYIEGK